MTFSEICSLSKVYFKNKLAQKNIMHITFFYKAFIFKLSKAQFFKYYPLF